MHEYMKRLKKANLMGVIDVGTINHAVVAHDVDCGVYDGADCDCNPDITIQTSTGPVAVQEDGTISVKSFVD